jgi:hypothetical protein
MRWDEVEERNLVLVHNLVKNILPEVERTGFSLHIGSVYFEPVVKRKGGNNERAVVGIKISSAYDWTSISKVMMRTDGSVDVAKLKNKVKEMQDTIKDVFDKHNKKSVGENMKLAETVIRKYEAKGDYEVYHSSYTSAVQAAEDFAIKNKYEVDKDKMSIDIGMNTRRPKEGDTTKFMIDLFKDGKEQRKKLHAQVYCMQGGSKFELNMYIS